MDGPLSQAGFQIWLVAIPKEVERLRFDRAHPRMLETKVTWKDDSSYFICPHSKGYAISAIGKFPHQHRFIHVY